MEDGMAVIEPGTPTADPPFVVDPRAVGLRHGGVEGHVPVYSVPVPESSLPELEGGQGKEIGFHHLVRLQVNDLLRVLAKEIVMAVVVAEELEGPAIVAVGDRGVSQSLRKHITVPRINGGLVTSGQFRSHG